MAKKKHKVGEKEHKLPSSLSFVFARSLNGSCLRFESVGEDEDPKKGSKNIPVFFSSLLYNQFDVDIPEKEKRIYRVYKVNDDLFGYAFINNPSTDGTGYMTVAVVDQDRKNALFNLKMMIHHFEIEGVTAAIRIIYIPKNINENCIDRSFEEKYKGFKSDITLPPTTGYSLKECVYKNLLIPRHGKYWLIRTCDDYWNTPELHRQVVDMRQYYDYIFDYSESFMEDARKIILERFLKCKPFLYDVNPDNGRPSIDYLIDSMYGYDKQYFVLPLTVGDIEDETGSYKFVVDLFKIVKEYADIDLFRSRFGFYIHEVVEDFKLYKNDPYSRNADNKNLYVIKECSDEIISRIYQ